MTQQIVPQEGPEIQQEFLCYTETAILLGIGGSAVYKFMKQYNVTWDKKSHCCPMDGKTRMMKVVDKQLLLEAVKNKGVAHSNQHEKKFVAPPNIDNMNKNAQATPIQMLLQVVQQMADMESRFDQKIQEVKQFAIETPPTDLVTSQREFLNDRLRYYCQQTEMSHGYVWRKLHTYIGRDSINDYKFGDFKPAIRYLKEMYKQSHIEWN